MPTADENACLALGMFVEWTTQILYLPLLYLIARRAREWATWPQRLRTVIAVVAVILLAGSIFLEGDPTHNGPLRRFTMWSLLLVSVAPTARQRMTVLLLATIDFVYLFTFSARLVGINDVLLLQRHAYAENVIEAHLQAMTAPVWYLMGHLGLTQVQSVTLDGLRAIAAGGATVILAMLTAFIWGAMRFLWVLLFGDEPFPGTEPIAPPARPQPWWRRAAWTLLVVGALLAALAALVNFYYQATFDFYGKLLMKLMLLVVASLPVLAAAAVTPRHAVRRLPFHTALLFAVAGAFCLWLGNPRETAMGAMFVYMAEGLLAFSGLAVLCRTAYGRWSWWKVLLVSMLALATPFVAPALALIGLGAELAAGRLLHAGGPAESASARRLRRLRRPRLRTTMAVAILAAVPSGIAMATSLAAMADADLEFPSPVARIRPLPADPWTFSEDYCATLDRRPCRWDELSCPSGDCQCDDYPCAVTRFVCDVPDDCPANRSWPGAALTMTALVDEATGERMISVPSGWYTNFFKGFGPWPRQFYAPPDITDLREAGYVLDVFCCGGEADMTREDGIPGPWLDHSPGSESHGEREPGPTWEGGKGGPVR